MVFRSFASRSRPLGAAFAVVGAVALSTSTRPLRNDAPSRPSALPRKPIYDDTPTSTAVATLPPSTASDTPNTDADAPPAAQSQSQSKSRLLTSWFSSSSDSSSDSSSSKDDSTGDGSTKSSPTADGRGDSLPTTATSPTPTDRLAQQVRRARLRLYDASRFSEVHLHLLLDRAFAAEHAVAERARSLRAPPSAQEPAMLPSLVYALVAGMAGAVLTRNRSILLRFTVPVVAGVGTAAYLLPVTAGNVARELETWERQHTPVLAGLQTQTTVVLRDSWRRAEQSARAGRQWTEEQLKFGRETVEGWVRKS